MTNGQRQGMTLMGNSGQPADPLLKRWLDECSKVVFEEEAKVGEVHEWPTDLKLNRDAVYQVLRQVLSDPQYGPDDPLPWPRNPVPVNVLLPQDIRGKSLAHRIFHAAGGHHR